MPTYTGLTSPPRDKTRPLSPRTLTYLSDAIRNYDTARTIDSSDGLTWLGLGCQCEEAIPFPQALVAASKALALYTAKDAEGMRQLALRNYRKAYSLTIKADTSHPRGLINPVSLEAALRNGTFLSTFDWTPTSIAK